MKIDWNKLVVLLCPTFLRLPKLVGCIQACIAPIGLAYNNLQKWATDIQLQQATTWQVMSLEMMLNYRLLGVFERLIIIVDGDGITSDFNVVIPPNVIVDENEICAYVDKYKLLGKRYNIVGGNITYTCQWIDFEDQIIKEEFAAVWINFEDQIVPVGTVDVKVYAFAQIYNDSVNGTKIGMRVTAEMQQQAADSLYSDLSVRIDITCMLVESVQSNPVGFEKQVFITVPKDTMMSGEVLIDLQTTASILPSSLIYSITQITPSSDNYFNYIKG